MKKKAKRIVAFIVAGILFLVFLLPFLNMKEQSKQEPDEKVETTPEPIVINVPDREIADRVTIYDCNGKLVYECETSGEIRIKDEIDGVTIYVPSVDCTCFTK